MDPLTHLLDHPRAHNAFTLRVVMQAPWAVDIRDEAALDRGDDDERIALAEHSDGAFELAPGDVVLSAGPIPIASPTPLDRRADRGDPSGPGVPDAGRRRPASSMTHGVRTWGNDPDRPGRHGRGQLREHQRDRPAGDRCAA